MPFKFSRCICLQSPQRDKLVAFYRNVMGMELVNSGPENVELKAEPFRIFFDRGELLGPIMEFYVPDLEKAREELVNHGCQIVRWEGKGKCCYVRDPFGFHFNLWEEPEAFQN